MSAISFAAVSQQYVEVGVLVLFSPNKDYSADARWAANSVEPGSLLSPVMAFVALALAMFCLLEEIHHIDVIQCQTELVRNKLKRKCPDCGCAI